MCKGANPWAPHCRTRQEQMIKFLNQIQSIDLNLLLSFTHSADYEPGAEYERQKEEDGNQQYKRAPQFTEHWINLLSEV
jgi:hypothetical protein